MRSASPPQVYPQLRALAPGAPGFTDASWAAVLSGFGDGWCSGVRCIGKHWPRTSGAAKTWELDGLEFGSGAGFNRTSVWLRALPLLCPTDGARAGGHIASKPVHDSAIVFAVPTGQGQIVVSGLSLGFELLPWTHCGGSDWATKCPIEALWMLRTLIAAAEAAQ